MVDIVSIIQDPADHGHLQLLLLEDAIVKINDPSGYTVYSTYCEKGIFSFDLNILPKAAYSLVVDRSRVHHP